MKRVFIRRFYSFAGHDRLLMTQILEELENRGRRGTLLSSSTERSLFPPAANAASLIDSSRKCVAQNLLFGWVCQRMNKIYESIKSHPSAGGGCGPGIIVFLLWEGWVGPNRLAGLDTNRLRGL